MNPGAAEAGRRSAKSSMIPIDDQVSGERDR
jgi:hypothetical protein